MRVLNLNINSCKTQKKIKNPRTGSVFIWRETYPIVYPHIQVWNLHIRKKIITGNLCVSLQEFIRYTHMDYSKLNFSCSSFGFVNVLIQYQIPQYPLVKTPTYPEINAVLQFDGSCGSRTSLMWRWKLTSDLVKRKKKKVLSSSLGMSLTWSDDYSLVKCKVSDYYDDWNIQV
jgi:hypothetical protein